MGKGRGRKALAPITKFFSLQVFLRQPSLSPPRNRKIFKTRSLLSFTLKVFAKKPMVVLCFLLGRTGESAPAKVVGAQSSGGSAKQQRSCSAFFHQSLKQEL